MNSDIEHNQSANAVSMEAYFKRRWEKTAIGSEEYDRQTAYTVPFRVLRKLCERMEIDLSVFIPENKRSYSITKETAELFDYLLDRFQKCHQLRGNKISSSEISREELVTIRQLLLLALWSSDLQPVQIETSLINFEDKTNCPIVLDYLPLSELSIEAIKYWEDECVDLDRGEIDRLLQDIEYNYRHVWRPRMIELARETIIRYRKAIQKPLAQEDVFSKTVFENPERKET